jgi:diguanylate cyclase (GGDEF)-like protein
LQSFFEQEQSRQSSSLSELTLLTMDLDSFKQVNAAIGHKLGDQLLKEIAERIRQQLRREDKLIRYAGNEFMALLQNTQPEAVSEIAYRIQTAIAEYHPAMLEGTGITLGLSIGQARLGADGRTLEQLLDAAEARLQADKAARRSLSQFDAAAQAPRTLRALQPAALN